MARLEQAGQGQISSLIRIVSALGRLEDFDGLLQEATPRSIEHPVRPGGPHSRGVQRRPTRGLGPEDDNHLKNVGRLLDPERGWRLSPGFDLTYSPRPERWTTVGGIGREVGRRPLLALAAEAGIQATQARDILDQVCEAMARLQKER